MPASMTIKEHKRPLDEMAYGRKDIKIEARGQFTPMFQHWILVRWAADNARDTWNYTHWQKELIAALWNVGSMELTKGNSRSAVHSAINEEYFTNMQLQNKSFLKRIQNLCRLEHISLDVEEYEACFKAELPKLVDVMASGDYDQVCDYVFALAKSSET